MCETRQSPTPLWFRRNKISIPGTATPSEAFTAIAAGADALKLFPGEAISPNVLKAIKVVLPPLQVWLCRSGDAPPANRGTEAFWPETGAVVLRAPG